MSRKAKFDFAIKVEAVKKYLRQQASFSEICRNIGCNHNTLLGWVNIYVNEGPIGLRIQQYKRSYSLELKRSAVKDYLEGKGSYLELVRKYGLRSTSVLGSWIRAYNTHGVIESHRTGEKDCMRKAKKTTYEERIRIVQDCLANGKDYGKTALKFQCSYQQVRSWVQRYKKMGSAGLEDRRGKRAGTQPARTAEEELRNKVAELERKNKDLQMENDILKKVRELEIKGRHL